MVKVLYDGRKIQVKRIRADSGEVWEVSFIGKQQVPDGFKTRQRDFVYMKLSIFDLDLARVGIYAKDWILRAILPVGGRPDMEG